MSDLMISSWKPKKQPVQNGCFDIWLNNPIFYIKLWFILQLKTTIRIFLGKFPPFPSHSNKCGQPAFSGLHFGWPKKTFNTILVGFWSEGLSPTSAAGVDPTSTPTSQVTSPHSLRYLEVRSDT